MIRETTYSAKAHPGGYYTYDSDGRFTGFAVSPQTPFRNAPRRVAAVIRKHSRAQRVADKKAAMTPCADCGKPNPRAPGADTCGRVRCP